MSELMSDRPRLVYGLAVAGVSTVRALLRHGCDVVVADDVDHARTCRRGRTLGVELIDATTATADTTARRRSLDAVSGARRPGDSLDHRSGATPMASRSFPRSSSPIGGSRNASARPRADASRSPATDGKTTTTKFAVHLLEAAGVRSVDAGNTDTPLVDAIDAVDELGRERYDAFVVECSSFRLAWTPTFRADAAAWLNLQPDHLNWHRSMEAYEAAKAQVFANQIATTSRSAIAADPVVMARTSAAPARQRSFGSAEADYRSRTALRWSGHGRDRPARCVATPTAPRHHERPGRSSTRAGDRSGRRRRRGQRPCDVRRPTAPTRTRRHDRRCRLVQRLEGDHTPRSDRCHPVVRADRVDRRWSRQGRRSLLDGDRRRTIGGRDRDRHNGTDHRRTLHRCWCRRRARVVDVGTLARAVSQAAAWAQEGDVVLLSPGCASLDQFANFEERGDAYRHLVAELADAPPTHSQEVSA